MSDFGGIIQSTGFQLNSQRPVDLKQFCTTTQRLSLTYVQRYKSMLVLDVDEDKWFMLDNNPLTDITVLSDWVDAGIGGAGALGFYVEVVVLGDAEGPTVITHDLNNEYVHVSAYLLPGREKIQTDVRLLGSNSIEVNGFGESHSVMFLIGQGGGSSFAQAKSMTYNDAKNLRDTGGLIVGNWYLINDYQTKNNAGFGEVHTAIIEQLYLQSVAVNGFANRAYSKDNFNDIIYYDFDDNQILETGVDSEWENSSFLGGNFTIGNVTSTTFDINTTLLVNESFYMEVGDSSDFYSYDQAMENTHFTVTSIVGGQRITILDSIDLTDGGYNYIMVEGDVILAERNGYIKYRENTIHKIKCHFDYYGCMYNRAKLDTTTVPNWVSTTAYTTDTIVLRNNVVWLCLYDNTGQSPTTNNHYWVTFIDDVDTNYSFANDTIANTNITLTAPKLFNVFCDYDRTTETATYTIDGFTNIECKSENVIFKHTNSGDTKNNILIDTGSHHTTINGRINSMVFGKDSNNTITQHNTYISSLQVNGYISNSIIRYVSNTILSSQHSMIVSQMTNCNIGNGNKIRFRYANGTIIGSNTYNLRIGTTSFDIFGSNTINCYFDNMEKNVLGSGTNNIISETATFYGNKIGNNWRSFYIHSNVSRFSYNVFGSGVGKIGTYLNVINYWEHNEIGNFVFWQGTSTFGGILSRCSFGSNNIAITIDRHAFNSHFGHQCQRNHVGGLNKATFEDGNQNHDFDCDITDSIFRAGTLRISSHQSGVSFRNNIVTKMYNYDFGLSATHIFNAYPCTIYERPDATRRLSYMGDSDLLTVIDPTT